MIRRIFYSLAAVVLISSCKDEKVNYTSFVTPETGEKIASGSSFNVKLQFADAPDSVVYFIDSTRMVMQKDTGAVKLSTTGLMMGNHTLTATVYANGSMEEVTSNIIVLAAQAPKEYSFRVINTYPHDPTAYTEGLEFHDGYLYESTGKEGESKVKRVDLKTGRSVQEVTMDPKYFGEGLTVVGNKIIQLTYTTSIGFVYDKATLKQVADFPYPSDREGWGLCFDGKRIYNTDGSNSIYFLDKDTYRTTGSIQVYDNNGPVDSLNELEYIDGKLYANIYQTAGPYANKILIIDPATGVVEATINLIGLNPEKDKEGNADYILNGIAYDKKDQRLFVTGKYWSKLFEIAVVKN
ncbi:MAG: glutaminyl-peptide cyclotransferase [Pedobacter sp.]|nr:MAG: glutaminyl-peptide cyclotransferase [Pedobacter sp.]